jgi:hypothetical protein
MLHLLCNITLYGFLPQTHAAVYISSSSVVQPDDGSVVADTCSWPGFGNKLFEFIILLIIISQLLFYVSPTNSEWPSYY